MLKFETPILRVLPAVLVNRHIAETTLGEQLTRVQESFHSFPSLDVGRAFIRLQCFAYTRITDRKLNDLWPKLGMIWECGQTHPDRERLVANA
jgi:hypothetical protein